MDCRLERYSSIWSGYEFDHCNMGEYWIEL